MTYDEKLDYSLELAISGKVEESEKILKELHIKNAKDPRVLFNLGWHDFRNGDLKSAFEKMVYGRHLGVFGSKNPGIPKPIWKNEELKTKTILFNSEGGYGDQIINLRFVKKFNELGAKVVLSCSSQLFNLFKDIPWIHQLVSLESAGGVYCDYWVPAMHAPHLLNLSYDDLWFGPYLESKRKFNLRKDKLKIGLRWAGNPKFEHEQHRRFNPSIMLGLCDMFEADFYSLQKDDNLVDNLPQNVTDMQYYMNDWTDTASIISELDLVITSCTSIAHLAASMGKMTWVVVPALPYYIWSQPGNKSKWYGDNVTLYKQITYGEWESPFKSIENDLRLLIS